MRICGRYLLILGLLLAAGGALAQGLGLGFGVQDVRHLGATAPPAVTGNLLAIGGGNILAIGGGKIQCMGPC